MWTSKYSAKSLAMGLLETGGLPLLNAVSFLVTAPCVGKSVRRKRCRRFTGTVVRIHIKKKSLEMPSKAKNVEKTSKN